ncbi:cytochrome P450 [Actinoplanes lutulentus]|uniref:Cytochrome P450 n=1 Tax=Actinoplanes lutulentus TaxID=1287878 RepID=A0A327Z633_9ACTN|nr:cytochrome P450 [Actinoplanes lutulentus]MBB2947076.1 cytochrome P450 [Actinoplanes lutulentus]RAK30573.1 cytochrome P450 [Actinoplanes lutulentus]
MPDAPYYPMHREARCPFAPAPEIAAMPPVGQVRIWDGSTPWFVTRHADQRALLNDPRLSIDEKLPGYPHMTRARAAMAPHIPSLITNTDPPEHTRLRRTVNAPFMVKRVEALRPRIQRIFDGLVDDMLAGDNPADLVEKIGLPVPTLVITQILGVPYADHAFFQAASRRAISHDTDPDDAAQAGKGLGEYLGGLLAAKIEQPADDVLSEMGARVTAGEMTFAEAVTMGSAILIAGHETSASMISLGTLALLRNPDELRKLRENSDDPKFVANAAEELLRYLTIVHSGIRRIAVEDIELHGTTIKAGDGVIFDLAGANYDPAEFAEPDRLDLSRPARQHHAFGYGSHQCLGQSLARVELQVIYGTLYRRIPTLALAVPFEEVEFAMEGVAYGLTSLPVTW